MQWQVTTLYKLMTNEAQWNKHKLRHYKCKQILPTLSYDYIAKNTIQLCHWSVKTKHYEKPSFKLCSSASSA